MKPFHLHLIYLSIIAVLGVQNWQQKQELTSVANTLKLNDSALKANSSILKTISETRLDGLMQLVKGYPNATNLAFIKKVVFADDISISHSKILSEKINQSDSTIIKPIEPNKDSFATFHESLLGSIEDKRDRELLKKVFLSTQFMQNADFWDTYHSKRSYLVMLNNAVEVDRLQTLNYFSSKVTGQQLICGDSHLVTIAPHKTTVIEGEAFTGLMFAANYFSRVGSDVEFLVNGNSIPIKNGDAFVNLPNQTVGTKTLNLELRIRNPLTGQVETNFRTFEYEVLPKCSRDCR
jgi:hypothetical protein